MFVFERISTNSIGYVLYLNTYFSEKSFVEPYL